MKIVLCLLSVATAQFLFPGEFLPTIDVYHEFAVQYDDAHNIIIFVSLQDCFLVEAPDNTWDPIVRNEEDLNTAVEQIYDQIQAGRGLITLTEEEAAEAYGSQVEQWECHNKGIHRVRYSPRL